MPHMGTHFYTGETCCHCCEQDSKLVKETRNNDYNQRKTSCSNKSMMLQPRKMGYKSVSP